MSKVVKIIAGVALVALAIFQPELWVALGPIVFHAAAIEGIGVSLALSGVAGFIQKNSSSSTAIQNNQINVRQPISYREIVYGSVRKGGVIAFIGTSGSKNEFLHLVILLAGHKVNSIGTGNIYLDGVTLPLTSDGSGHFVPFSGNKYSGLVLAEFHNGDPSDTSQPFPQLTSDMGSSAWGASDLIRGVAKAHIRLKYDPTAFSSGVPQITFDIQGRILFDERTSASAYSANASLCLRDWLLDDMYGMAVGDPTLLDDTTFNAAANTCDEDVALREGGTQNRYECNGVFLASQPRGDVIKALLSGMMGGLVPPGDKWRCYAGAFRDSVFDITDDDIRGTIKYDVRVSRSNLANRISGTYVSASNNWQPSDFPPYISSAYFDEDGSEELWKDLTLPMETDGVRAQRLAKIYLELLRRQTPLAIPCKMTCFGLEPGDVITFTHERWGFDAKTFVVASASLTQQANDQQSLVSGDNQGSSNIPALGVDLVLYPFDVDIYAWDPDVDENTVDSPGTPLLPDSSSVSPPDGLSLLSDSSTTVTRADGIAHSQIKVTWTALSDPSIASVEVYVTPSGGTQYLDGRAAPTDTIYFINKNLIDGTSYTVALRCVNVAGAHSSSVTGSVTCSGTTSTITADVSGGRYSDGTTLDSNHVRSSASGNLVMNGAFEFGDNRNWVDANKEHNEPFEDIAGVSSSSSSTEGGFTAKTQTGTSDSYLTSLLVPVDTSKSYALRARISNGPGIPAFFYMGFACFDENKQKLGDSGVYTYTLAANQPIPNPWTVYSAIISGEGSGITQFLSGTKYICPAIKAARDSGGSPVAGAYLAIDYFKITEATNLDTMAIDGPTRGAVTGANTSYRPLSNPLTATDSGSSATVLIAAFTMRIPGRSDISVGSGTVAGLSYATLYYIYYDDASYAGGAVTYHATTVKETAINASGRFYLGSIMTPQATGADSIGNNDGGAGAQLGGILINYPTSGALGSTTGGGTVSITAGGIANVFDHDATTDCEMTAIGAASRAIVFSGLSSLSFASLYAVRLVVEHEMTTNATSGNPVVVSTSIFGAPSITHSSGFSRVKESITLPLPLPPVFSLNYVVGCDASGHTTVAKVYDLHIEELF